MDADKVKRQEQIENALIIMIGDITERNTDMVSEIVYNPADYDYYFSYYGKHVFEITISGVKLKLTPDKNARIGVLSIR